jgi:hypothetical protein
MRLGTLLQKVFSKASTNVDKRLHRVLLDCAETLCESRCLSISGLGRSLKRAAYVKHNIKTVDRLFGNVNLLKHRHHYFQVCATWLIGNNTQPYIIVDWSCLTPCGKFHFLRASIPVGGRALPILDMAFTIKDYASPKAHAFFLETLKTILPAGCRPIVITDAGFRGPWFKQVTTQGWDFVGRARHLTHYKNPMKDTWETVKTLYQQASSHATYLFKTELAKANPLECHFYSVRQKKKNRVRKNLSGKKIQCSVSLKHAKSGNEPWLIVSSLSNEQFTAQQIMSIYKKRMQIEESFRDLKNTRNGFSLRHCRTHHVMRFDVALLIAALSMFILWLIGLMKKCDRSHVTYQANTIKHRNVLSAFSIGYQVIKRNELLKFKIPIVQQVINRIQQEASLC